MKKYFFSKFSPTSYVKLQQAYFSESNMAGGWTLIGYTAPNGGETTNFVYGIGDITAGASTALSDAKVGWQAAGLKDLNECTATGTTGKGGTKLDKSSWTVSVNGTTDLEFDAVASGAGCVALTPTFGNIGK